MVTSIAWEETLRPASFRGVPFHWEQDSRSGGRRLAIHEFPGGEQHLVEDMGRAAPRYSFTAYVLTPATADALWAACNAGSPGPLATPLDGIVLAACASIRTAHEKDRLGYLAFDLEFVPTGIAAGGFSLPHAPSALLGLVDQVFSRIDDGLGEALELDIQAPILEDLATTAMSDMLDRVDTVVRTVALPAKVSQEVAAGFAEARGRIFDPRRGLRRSVDAVTGALRAVMTEADPDVGATVGRTLSVPLPDPAAADLPLGATRKKALAFRRATWSAVEASALSVLIRQEAIARWTSRGEAVAARDRIKAAFDAATPRIAETMGETAWRRLVALRDYGVETLTKRITDLAPVVLVEMGSSMPSARVAYEIYGDADRARGIVNRNAVSMPAFMPTRLEVVQP